MKLVLIISCDVSQPVECNLILKCDADVFTKGERLDILVYRLHPYDVGGFCNESVFAFAYGLDGAPILLSDH